MMYLNVLKEYPRKINKSTEGWKRPIILLYKHKSRLKSRLNIHESYKTAIFIKYLP